MEKETKPLSLLEKVTTIHGTNHFQSKSGFRAKFLWWLALTTNLVLTIMFIVIIKEKLRSDHIYTKVDSTCQVKMAPFPAISICNFNMVSSKETANIAKLLKRHNRTEKEINKFFEDLPKLKNYVTPEADNATEIMNILRSYYYTMDTIMEEVYQKCENLLLYCTFNRKVKNCMDIFNLIKTVEGHCCAFNYAALNDVSEVSFLPHDDTLEYYDGDDESDHVSGPIITTSESGRKSGLTVVFNVEPDDYPSWSNSLNYGAKILVSDPNDFPETSVLDLYVTTGTSVDVKVEPKVYQSEPDVRHVSPTHRACWFHDEIALEHTDRYSYETCVTECSMLNFLVFCGCTPYKYPRDDSRRFCELADLPCMYNLTVYGKGVPCDPPCYVECRDKNYDFIKNTVPFETSDFPSEAREVTMCALPSRFMKIIDAEPNKYYTTLPKPKQENDTQLTTPSDTYWIQFTTNIYYNKKHDRDIDHLAAIKVYFGKPTCNCYKLTLLMDANYFIATYGGVLGLSFGASLLTVLELIYLIASSLHEIFLRHVKRAI